MDFVTSHLSGIKQMGESFSVMPIEESCDREDSQATEQTARYGIVIVPTLNSNRRLLERKTGIRYNAFIP